MRTLCFSRSSLLRGALMMTRRSLEGALKCALRDFRREEAIANEKGRQYFIHIRFSIFPVRIPPPPPPPVPAPNSSPPVPP